MEDNSLYDLIKGWWEGYEVNGNPGFIFWKKLQMLKENLKTWNWTHFGSTKRKMDDILNEIQIIDQKDADREATLEDKLNRINFKNEFKKWARLEALRLKNKAKDKWLDEGDNNTGYFHRSANQRRRQNFISCLVIDGEIQEDSEVIKSHIGDYYAGLYKENIAQRPFMEYVQFSTISSVDKVRLESTISEEEILGTIKEMERNKAPGPDGYPIEVFTGYWKILGEDFMKVVKHFELTGSLDWRLNNTFISLIPKKETVEVVKDFRPISLINTCYKIIAKTLATRLKQVLPSLISDTQQIAFYLLMSVWILG